MNMNIFPEGKARILIIDDNKSIHADIRDVLECHGPNDEEYKELEGEIFGEQVKDVAMQYDIDSVYQGKDGYEMVVKAKEDGNPYALAFVDMRMPPGWDGGETIQNIWRADPDIEIVICTAYADQTWSELIDNLYQSDKFIIIKKPFDIIEVRQMTRALTAKWAFNRTLQKKLDNLQAEAQSRIRSMSQMEVELKRAQKLETVGQLAAGIVDEIDTPIQFVGDSVQFLKAAFSDLEPIIEEYRKHYQSYSEKSDDDLQQTEKVIDVEYLAEEIPKALCDAFEGLSRVVSIVSSMKQFAHPASETGSVDINKALSTLLTVASSEYKYTAEVKTEFEENMPLVNCMIWDLNQVFLHLIINAAHAIADSVENVGQKGLITIKTKLDAEYIVISISDNGCGIPKSTQNQILQLPATEADTGGKGLSFAHSMIVDKYGGELYFETEEGKGSTFFVCLPLESAENEFQKDISKAS